ncbi:hypothetical protein HDU86_007563 [Geranomyces michiganensis]|nr:hypothetical protein HDU86_007563 [Geranomyces michiganensis]
MDLCDCVIILSELPSTKGAEPIRADKVCDIHKGELENDDVKSPVDDWRYVLSNVASSGLSVDDIKFTSVQQCYATYRYAFMKKISLEDSLNEILQHGLDAISSLPFDNTTESYGHWTKYSDAILQAAIESKFRSDAHKTNLLISTKTATFDYPSNRLYEDSNMVSNALCHIRSKLQVEMAVKTNLESVVPTDVTPQELKTDVTPQELKTDVTTQELKTDSQHWHYRDHIQQTVRFPLRNIDSMYTEVEIPDYGITGSVYIEVLESLNGYDPIRPSQWINVNLSNHIVNMAEYASMCKMKLEKQYVDKLFDLPDNISTRPVKDALVVYYMVYKNYTYYSSRTTKLAVYLDSKNITHTAIEYIPIHIYEDRIVIKKLYNSAMIPSLMEFVMKVCYPEVDPPIDCTGVDLTHFNLGQRSEQSSAFDPPMYTNLEDKVDAICVSSGRYIYMVHHMIVIPGIFYLAMLLSEPLRQYITLDDRIPYHLTKDPAVTVTVSVAGVRFTLKLADTSYKGITDQFGKDVEFIQESLFIISDLDYNENMGTVEAFIAMVMYYYEKTRDQYGSVVEQLAGDYKIKISSKLHSNASTLCVANPNVLRHSKNPADLRIITKEEYLQLQSDPDAIITTTIENGEARYIKVVTSNPSRRVHTRKSDKVGENPFLQVSERINNVSRTKLSPYKMLGNVITKGCFYVIPPLLAVALGVTFTGDFHSGDVLISSGHPLGRMKNNMNTATKGYGSMYSALEIALGMAVTEDMVRYHPQESTLVSAALQDNITSTLDELRSELYHEEEFCNVKTLYRVLEELCNVNIYILYIDSDVISLVGSEYRGPDYIWEHRADRKSVILLINGLATYKPEIGYHLCVVKCRDRTLLDTDDIPVQRLMKLKSGTCVNKKEPNMPDGNVPTYQYVGDNGVVTYLGYGYGESILWISSRTLVYLQYDSVERIIVQSIVETLPTLDQLIDMIELSGLSITAKDSRVFWHSHCIYGLFTEQGYCPCKIEYDCDYLVLLDLPIQSNTLPDEDRGSMLDDYARNIAKSVSKGDHSGLSNIDKVLSTVSSNTLTTKQDKYIIRVSDQFIDTTVMSLNNV